MRIKTLPACMNEPIVVHCRPSASRQFPFIDPEQKTKSSLVIIILRMKTMDLVALAGSLLALKTAINKGADAVYLGLRNATNAAISADSILVKPTFAVASSLHQHGKQVLFCHQYLSSSQSCRRMACSDRYCGVRQMQ